MKLLSDLVESPRCRLETLRSVDSWTQSMLVSAVLYQTLEGASAATRMKTLTDNCTEVPLLQVEVPLPGIEPWVSVVVVKSCTTAQE